MKRCNSLTIFITSLIFFNTIKTFDELLLYMHVTYIHMYMIIGGRKLSAI